MAKIEAAKPLAGGAKTIALAVFALLSVLPDPVALAEQEERPVIKGPRGGGRELVQNCVLCHKYDGRGGPSEGGYGADLRVTKLTRDEIIQVITDGRMSKGMPPFKGMLDEEKIETLATFIMEELRLKP